MVFWKLWGLFVAILFAELRASQPPIPFLSIRTQV